MNGIAPEGVRAGLMRGSLALLSFPALAVGAWALLLPQTFYGDFPSAGKEWVSALDPYNGHCRLTWARCTWLLAVAAVSFGRGLVRASLVTWLVFAVPHLVYHAATHHRHLLLIDRVGNLVGLGFVVLLPTILLVVSERP